MIKLFDVNERGRKINDRGMIKRTSRNYLNEQGGMERLLVSVTEGVKK
jgi:hypothetical protein